MEAEIRITEYNYLIHRKMEDINNIVLWKVTNAMCWINAEINIYNIYCDKCLRLFFTFYMYQRIHSPQLSLLKSLYLIENHQQHYSCTNSYNYY